MKILMLVNWKIEYCEEKPADKQPPDYKVEGKDYWFYRYFKNKPEVDVIDIRLVNDNHNLKDQISQSAFEHVKANCNERNMAKAIEEFFDEISVKGVHL